MLSPADVFIGGIYRHYKGSRVKVLMEALHSETKEPMVIYVHLEDGYIWARPKKMFLETVIADGQKKLRFTPINQKMVIKTKE